MESQFSCDLAVWVGERFLAFLKECEAFICRVNWSKTRVLDPDDEGIVTLQNVKNHLPTDDVSHPRRTESSATLL